MSASTARQAMPAVSRRSYVSLSNFNNALYNYSYGFDERLLKEVGSLSLNPDGTAQNCPKGRILHENGKKLNPADGNFSGANDGVTTYMVGVYDPVSGLSGFINPNAPTFGIQNTDKPIYLGHRRGSSSDFLGNGVLTNGPLETTSTVTSGSSITAGSSVTAGTYLASKQVNVPLYNTGGGAVPYNPANSAADVFIDYTAGNVFVITAPAGSSITTIWVNFNPNPLFPGDIPAVNGTVMTLICVNRANRAVNVSFDYFNRGIVKRTSNTLVLPDGDPNPIVSNIMFAGANNYIIELNRSGVMGL